MLNSRLLLPVPCTSQLKRIFEKAMLLPNQLHTISVVVLSKLLFGWFYGTGLHFGPRTSHLMVRFSWLPIISIIEDYEFDQKQLLLISKKPLKLAFILLVSVIWTLRPDLFVIVELRLSSADIVILIQSNYLADGTLVL